MKTLETTVVTAILLAVFTTQASADICFCGLYRLWDEPDNAACPMGPSSGAYWGYKHEFDPAMGEDCGTRVATGIEVICDSQAGGSCDTSTMPATCNCVTLGGLGGQEGPACCGQGDESGDQEKESKESTKPKSQSEEEGASEETDPDSVRTTVTTTITSAVFRPCTTRLGDVYPGLDANFVIVDSEPTYLTWENSSGRQRWAKFFYVRHKQQPRIQGGLGFLSRDPNACADYDPPGGAGNTTNEVTIKRSMVNRIARSTGGFTDNGYLVELTGIRVIIKTN
ncbi:hypothetical protein [Stratiformator vulcanicus]|uniref:Uncharacterized protein n=1 Tax=Stratiformator vulcanicus TaxID=2527980 RepID=A0A517QYC6_9PLAN|nr:hypothetical protein [Stratiformator vulcanicus]QDT36635.1 hypothetical protein Pan189_09960 [Stratiformator vulcanicus]